MKNILKVTFVAALLCSVATSAFAERVSIPVDAKQINYGGSLHITQQGDSLLLNRHSAELFTKEDTRINQDKAITSSGIYIEFKSDSREVEMNFSAQKDGSYRTPILGVYRDGEYQGAISMEQTTLLSNQSDGAVTWKIYMPIFYSTVFKGLTLDEGAKLYAVKKSKRPIYFAVGNSITHGVGQAGVSSDRTYAGVIAEAKGWELYNLAVGGSQISPSVADDFKGIKADYITILWGYNDWNGGVSLEEIESRYSDLLTRIRANQPKARIYVITPTYTKTEVRKNGDTTPITAVKEIQERLVKEMQAKGDKLISTIDGAAYSSAEDLKDVVHFNTEGAQRFGEELIRVL